MQRQQYDEKTSHYFSVSMLYVTHTHPDCVMSQIFEMY